MNGIQNCPFWSDIIFISLYCLDDFFSKFRFFLLIRPFFTLYCSKLTAEIQFEIYIKAIIPTFLYRRHFYSFLFFRWLFSKFRTFANSTFFVPFLSWKGCVSWNSFGTKIQKFICHIMIQLQRTSGVWNVFSKVGQ